jgi:hypothetical protein
VFGIHRWALSKRTSAARETSKVVAHETGEEASLWTDPVNTTSRKSKSSAHQALRVRRVDHLALSRIHQRSARQENFQCRPRRSERPERRDLLLGAGLARASTDDADCSPVDTVPHAVRFRVAADAYLNDFICTERLKWVHACRTCPTTVLLPLLLLANGTAGLRASTRLRLFGQIRAQSREGLLNTGHALFSAPATMSDFTASAAR